MLKKPTGARIKLGKNVKNKSKGGASRKIPRKK
jgi:hypothetical protein